MTCQEIIKFCSGSAKLLLFAGSFITLLLAIVIGYMGWFMNAFYQDIDLSLAQEKRLSYHFHLLVAGYLVFITLFCFFSAHYDQKNSIITLSMITWVNFALALVAISLVPAGTDVSLTYNEKLKQAFKSYNFTENTIYNQSHTDANSTSPTEIWDKLQRNGCCGFNLTNEWTEIPKSCCNEPNQTKESNQTHFKCLQIDSDHNKTCKDMLKEFSIESTFKLQLMLALIALINLYLATITGISTYWTFHYKEASQSAYT